MDYLSVIREMRKKIRDAVARDLQQQYEDNKRKGLYPYAGKYRRIEHIKKAQKLLKKRDKPIFREILFLFVLMSLFGLILYWLLFFIFLPR